MCLQGLLPPHEFRSNDFLIQSKPGLPALNFISKRGPSLMTQGRACFRVAQFVFCLASIMFAITVLNVFASQNSPATSNTSPTEDEETTVLSFEGDADSGLTRQVITLNKDMTVLQQFTGGVAAGDFDNDGDVDLYVVGTDDAPNALYVNDGTGKFHDIASEVGVNFLHWGSGPAFGDIDGDGDLDLFVGAIEGDPYYLLENRFVGSDAERKFIDITDEAGLHLHSESTVSGSFADYDQDGLLDLFLTHWGDKRQQNNDTETLWRNEGGRLFSNMSTDLGISSSLVEEGVELTLTQNLFDISGDGLPDLLIASDSNESQTYIYNGSYFVISTDRRVIKDQSGMGAAVGDYDNDGDFDWFVTSIYDIHVGGSSFGNRLYQNNGQGFFTDVTDDAGVANGNWGWGACMKDFDHDGDLDIFHVNGWDVWEEYRFQPSRFFENQGDGSFNMINVFDIGIIGRGQGRGLACFDADRDGDIDILVVNLTTPHLALYRNNSTNLGNYVVIKLRGLGSNTFGVGALVTLTTTEGTQIRQLGASNNYASHNPLEVHFGLGSATTADVKVEWRDQARTISELSIEEVNQVYTIEHPDRDGLQLSVQFGDGDGLYSAGDVVEIAA
ncbi:MAG: CRTAC1 family protein, partial [Gammaproteobacteria bacterium]|nr:CRTAC1 family protein [Gammaproteobacteria bacterium]